MAPTVPEMMEFIFIEPCVKDGSHCSTQRVASDINRDMLVSSHGLHSLDYFIEALQYGIKKATMKARGFAQTRLIPHLSDV